MSFALSDEHGRTLEVTVGTEALPGSVFFSQGDWCMEVPRCVFMEAIKAEVESSDFFRIVAGYTRPAYQRVA